MPSVRKIDKQMHETALQSGIAPKDTDAACAAFVKVLVLAGFDEQKFAQLGNEDLLEAARVYFASHPLASESKDPAGGNSLAPMARRKGPRTNWQR
jgi:hypothetical protein